MRFLIFLLFLFLLISCKIKSKNDTANNGFVNFPESYIELLDSTLIENSGLILWDDLLWTINDSDSKNELYAFHPKTGRIVKTVQLSNAINIDWEDIAQDEQYIYIAETGNNAGIRKDLQILIIEKSSITKEEVQVLTVDKIHFNFADQTDFTDLFRRNSYDCEALFVWNDSLYVFTKDWANFITKAYVMPKKPGNYSLFPAYSFDVKGLITGADINSNGEFVLIGYQDFKSFAWTFQKTDSTLFGNPHFIDLSMLENAQTEGICFSPKGDLFISCERTESYMEQVWRIKKK